MADWIAALTDWLKPFVQKLGHKKRRAMCPLYIAGLIGPGERKSIRPMAARIAPERYDRLHHFISDGIWDLEPIEKELARQADRLIGGSDAFLVIDDTSLPKKGDHSVGVAPQYASMLGKRANCQTLVSLTLARDEVQWPSDCGCSCRKGGQAIGSAWKEPGFPKHFAGRAASQRSRLRRSTG
jgi:SRSO17 transposase